MAHAHAPGHGSGQGHAHGEEGHEHHGIPVPVYWKVFWALMVLLVVTLLAAAFHLPPVGSPLGDGWLNLPVALIIAFAKVWLIVTYFMHLKISSTLVKVFAVSAFLWLIILFVLTLADYMSRGWLRQ
jgi:cytochrome c oxidase subunit 4